MTVTGTAEGAESDSAKTAFAPPPTAPSLTDAAPSEICGSGGACGVPSLPIGSPLSSQRDGVAGEVPAAPAPMNPKATLLPASSVPFQPVLAIV